MPTPSPVTVATVGSIITDLAVATPRVPRTGENILARSFRMGPGGKGANAAAALARLGARSLLFGSVGDDDLGRAELAALAREKVDTSGVGVDTRAQTGVAFIMVDDNKENTILVVPGANAVLEAEAVLEALSPRWQELSALLVDFEIPEPVVAGVVAGAAEHGVPVVVDAGPPRSYRADTWRNAAIVSPNRLETESLVGRTVGSAGELEAAAAEILAAGPRAVVIKLGREGCLVCTGREVTRVAAFQVETVDTTGAGDAFTAALTLGAARRLPLEQSVRIASAAGALAVTRFGTMPAMPTLREVEDFLAEQGGDT